ncbi:MAG: hypothetical protein U9R04_02225 [Chloroflexota bacterium]|nr:hypothetical protein [Chloroflexota bacterium]
MNYKITEKCIGYAARKVASRSCYTNPDHMGTREILLCHLVQVTSR